MAANTTDTAFAAEQATGAFSTAFPGESPLGQRTQRVAIFGILVAGCLVNLAFLFVVVTQKRLHNLTNAYLANLAVADSSVLVLGAAGAFAGALMLSHGWLSCAYTVAMSVCFYTSLLTVSLVTREQCNAVCNPFEHRASARKRANAGYFAKIWGGGLVCALLINLESVLKGHDCLMLFVSYNARDGPEPNERPHSVAYTDILRPVMVLLLAVANSAMYAKILGALRRHLRDCNSHNRTVPIVKRRTQRSQMLLTRMVAINTLVYFTCLAPLTALQVLNYARGLLQAPPLENETAGVASGTLSLLNSFVNPLIYLLTHEKHRHAFKAALLPTKCCRQSAAEKRTVQLAVIGA